MPLMSATTHSTSVIPRSLSQLSMSVMNGPAGGALPAGCREGTEQALRPRIFVHAPLRMPLHGEHEAWAGGRAQGLDRAVLGQRLDLQTGRQPVDSLGVQRVDIDPPGAAHHLLQLTAGT